MDGNQNFNTNNVNTNNQTYTQSMNNGEFNPNMNNGGYNPNMNINIEVDENVLREWGEFSIEDANANDNKIMAILAYIIPIVPFLLAEKNSKWVRFHTIQGMNYWIPFVSIFVVLFILTIIVLLIPLVGKAIAVLLALLMVILGIVILVFDVLGIVNVLQFKAKELPLVSKIKIFKK